jgi:hypothetical protein
MKAERRQYALYCDANRFLLWLGKSGAIGILPECNMKNISHNQGFGPEYGSFVNDTGLAGPTFFTGEKNFVVKELETFELIE